ncbi:ionotropic receptor 93a-like isoform X2 [Daphnia pulicaria]|nr:ionotropic receptor 93a-like isoform X2 [Daphnia pulicaria]
MGGVIVDTFAERFNFTYEMVRVTENRLEPQGKERGLFNYLWEKKCDLLIIGVGLTYGRFLIVDVTIPLVFEPYRFLIPVQGDTANINAVIKPFQWPVWLGLVISIAFVIIVLQLLENAFGPSKVPNRGNKTNKWYWLYYVRQTAKHYVYVFGNLLSQGGPCPSKHLSFRLVAGVWCLAAFIFVQAYTSILFTYIVTPVNHPLINSVYDIVEHSDIQLLVRKASTLNRYISNPNATGILPKLRKKLDSFPNSECHMISECINMIKPGSRKTFADVISAQLEVIKGHFDQTKKCDIQLAKESFLTVFASLALQKHSRYTDTINKGVMEFQQAGLFDHWESEFNPMPPQCLATTKSGNQKQETKPSVIKLSNLTGAFVVLLIGFSASFLIFLFELNNNLHTSTSKDSDMASNKKHGT